MDIENPGRFAWRPPFIDQATAWLVAHKVLLPGASVLERSVARALEELGRIIKTLYLLAYIDDEAYRRRILAQLNRGEGRHQLARVVFHGKRGELRQRYREGQEDQPGGPG